MNGTTVETVMLRVEQLRPNPYQPRRYFAPEDLADLVVSIRDHGLLQPVVVRPAPGDEGSYGHAFELVAGERRCRSVTTLGWEEIPAIVRDVSDREMLVLAVRENDDRQALTAVDRAVAYRRAIDELGMTQAEVAAEFLGSEKKQAQVAAVLGLLRLPGDLQDLVSQGRVNWTAARDVLVPLMEIGDDGRRWEVLDTVEADILERTLPGEPISARALRELVAATLADVGAEAPAPKRRARVEEAAGAAVDSAAAGRGVALTDDERSRVVEALVEAAEDEPSSPGAPAQSPEEVDAIVERHRERVRRLYGDEVPASTAPAAEPKGREGKATKRPAAELRELGQQAALRMQHVREAAADVRSAVATLLRRREALASWMEENGAILPAEDVAWLGVLDRSHGIRDVFFHDFDVTVRSGFDDGRVYRSVYLPAAWAEGHLARVIPIADSSEQLRIAKVLASGAGWPADADGDGDTEMCPQIWGGPGYQDKREYGCTLPRGHEGQCIDQRRPLMEGTSLVMAPAPAAAPAEPTQDSGPAPSAVTASLAWKAITPEFAQLWSAMLDALERKTRQGDVEGLRRAVGDVKDYLAANPGTVLSDPFPLEFCEHHLRGVAAEPVATRRARSRRIGRRLGSPRASRPRFGGKPRFVPLDTVPEGSRIRFVRAGCQEMELVVFGTNGGRASLVPAGAGPGSYIGAGPDPRVRVQVLAPPPEPLASTVARKAIDEAFRDWFRNRGPYAAHYEDGKPRKKGTAGAGDMESSYRHAWREAVRWAELGLPRPTGSGNMGRPEAWDWRIAQDSASAEPSAPNADAAPVAPSDWFDIGDVYAAGAKAVCRVLGCGKSVDVRPSARAAHRKRHEARGEQPEPRSAPKAPAATHAEPRHPAREDDSSWEATTAEPRAYTACRNYPGPPRFAPAYVTSWNSALRIDDLGYNQAERYAAALNRRYHRARAGAVSRLLVLGSGESCYIVDVLAGEVIDDQVTEAEAVERWEMMVAEEAAGSEADAASPVADEQEEALPLFAAPAELAATPTAETPKEEPVARAVAPGDCTEAGTLRYFLKPVGDRTEIIDRVTGEVMDFGPPPIMLGVCQRLNGVMEPPRLEKSGQRVAPPAPAEPDVPRGVTPPETDLKGYQVDMLLRDSLTTSEAARARWMDLARVGATTGEITRALCRTWGGSDGLRGRVDGLGTWAARGIATGPFLSAFVACETHKATVLREAPLIERVRRVMGIGTEPREVSDADFHVQHDALAGAV